MNSRIIAHLDMDAFFASVEERDKPWLRGLPIVVGADPLGGEGRGVVSTANYAARAYGIHSALPIRKAWECSERARKEGKPQCAFITPRFSKYSEASAIVMGILHEHSNRVQQTSVDEAYFDLTPCRSFRKAKILGEQIKHRIRKKTRLTASLGIAPNKMVAKIASDSNKPDGLVVLTPHKVEPFLEPLSARVIPGLGPKAEAKLKRHGVRTIRELKVLQWEELEQLFGSVGFGLYQKARGIAGDTLQSEQALPKSIGEHDTFTEDTSDFDFVVMKLHAIAPRIIRRMKSQGFQAFRTLVLTIRFADFETKTRSLTTTEPISQTSDLERRALKLLLPFFEKTENPYQKQIRMIGLRIEKFI